MRTPLNNGNGKHQSKIYHTGTSAFGLMDVIDPMSMSFAADQLIKRKQFDTT